MLPVKLGQRVYGVTTVGTIVPTLISQIELRDDKSSEDALSRAFESQLKGESYKLNLNFSFRVLRDGIKQPHLDFEGAYVEALSILEMRFQDESISVRDAHAARIRHEQLLTDKKSIRLEAEKVTKFQERDRLGLYVSRKDEEEWAQSDFPQNYFEPGTPIWIADAKKWQLIRGMVTGVHFAPRWKGRMVYYCGRFSNNEVGTVFKTKKAALNYLEQKFEKTLPGSLDRTRVQTEYQLTEAERERLQLEKIGRVADAMAAAGMFRGR